VCIFTSSITNRTISSKKTLLLCVKFNGKNIIFGVSSASLKILWGLEKRIAVFVTCVVLDGEIPTHES